MSTSENVRRPSRGRRTLIATAVVGVFVAVTLLTLGAASGRPVAQHGSGDASAAKSAMSSTHQLSRAQGHAAQISRVTSGNAAHSSSSSSSSSSSLVDSSTSLNLAPNRLLAATGCGIDGTNFEDADGNLTPATCLDWNSFAPVTWTPPNGAPYQDATTTNGAFTFFGATDAVNSQTDTSYTGGVKQATDCPTTTTGSVDNKTDLARIYVAETTAADGHEILYLAWVRGPLNNTSSDVHVGFEFNQGSSLCPAASAPFVHRTDGDILLVYNFTQGGTPTLAFATWQNGAWTTETTLDPGVAEANIWNGTGSTSDLLKPSGAPDPQTQEFGEGGVDLTAALAALGSGEKDCAKFGHVFGESRTSGSSTSAQMKDLVGARVDVSTCVSPTVTTTLKNAAGDGTIDNGSAVALGSSVYDTADFSGLIPNKTPTGKVQYTFFTNGSCQGTGNDAGLEQVDGQGNVPQSNTQGPLTPGSYSFEAQYISGSDPNYSDSDVSACEPFTVNQASSATATVVKDHGGAVVDAANPAALGSKVHDTATVTASPFTATGSVTYHLYSGLDCNSNNEIGTGQQVSLSGGAVPDSAETAALQAGSYSYQAVYSGDSNYTGSTGVCEPFKIAQAGSATATVVKDHGGAVVDAANPAALGSKVHDTATVTASPFTATGSVTYHLYSGLDCNSNNEIGTGQQVSLSGGAVPDSAETAALQAGSYSYQAVYSGDSNYTGSTGVCEPFKIAQAGSATATVVKDHGGAVVDAANPAALGSKVHDTATVTASPFTATGSVTYHLYSGLDCNSNNEIGTGQQVSLSGGAVPDSAETAALQAGSYSYQAVYSGDSNYTGSTGVCEPFKIAQAGSATATVVFDADTNAPWSGTENTGSSAYDTASVSSSNDSFTPSGTVSYQFFANATCSGDGTDAGTVTLDGAGNAPNSETKGPLGAGSYSFQATYSGDANFIGSTGPCEPFSLGLPDTSTATVVKDHNGAVVDAANPAALGSPVHDTATVSGQVGEIVPTGTVTYQLYSGLDCNVDNAIGDPETVTMSGGNVPDSAETAALQAGSYSYQAVYSGDANYATSTGPCEPFKIAQAGSSTDTVVKDHGGNVVDQANPAALGSKVHDTATVSSSNDSFTPSGTVTYQLYSGLDCNVDNAIGDPETVTMSGGNVPDSAETAALQAGSYSYQAVYSGDANYATSTGPCEPFKIAQAGSSTDTVVKDHGGNVVDQANPAALGSKVHDTATVSSSNDSFTPSGTVTYQLYSGLDCNVDNAIGDPETVTMSGGNVPDSAETAALQAGSYSFQAVYSGDANYATSTGPCEPFSVAQASLDASTTIRNAADDSAVDGGLPLGSSVYDTTQLSGAVEGFDPTGTVSYRFFQNGDCSGEGSSAGSDVALDGQSDTQGPLGAGSYSFQATYSGDGNYAGATSPCEPLTIGIVTPSASTTLKNAATDATVANGSALPHGSSVYDTAAIGNAGGFPLTGTVSFRFFHNGDCSGTPASVQTGVAVGGRSAATGALDEGSYGFQAMYVAGDDSNHTDSAWSACEPFSIQGLADLSVKKSGSPATQVLGTGNITWTMVVTNLGPDADTGVVVSDPMPGGNTFVSATTSKGSCTGGPILNCTIGDMAVGESVTITLITTPSTTGDQTNTVIVSGNQPESNTGNNTATATVQVTPQTFPPPVKPCVAVSKVTPKQLFVGRKTKVTIHLTQGGKVVKGIHVRIKGPKLNVRTKASNGKGVVKHTLKMKKAGILIFTPIASKACNTKRVGVTNVFTPPVTG